MAAATDFVTAKTTSEFNKRKRRRRAYALYNSSIFFIQLNDMEWFMQCYSYVWCYFNYRFVRCDMKTKGPVIVKQFKNRKPICSKTMTLPWYVRTLVYKLSPKKKSVIKITFILGNNNLNSHSKQMSRLYRTPDYLSVWLEQWGAIGTRRPLFI